MLPNVESVLESYEQEVLEKGDIDSANLFIALLCGYAAYLWRHKLMSAEELQEYFETLREEIVEGPDYLNPYVMELMSIIAQGLTDASFEEFKSKLRIVLKEDRLDIMEV